MGCDITILSKHNLNIATVETLAIDLSNRFGFTIEYGYYAVAEYNELLQNGLKEDFISLGLIEKKPFVKKYKLIDEKFQQKLLFEKFGEKLFEMQEYWHWYDNEMLSQERIAEEKKEFHFTDYYLDIHSETAESSYMNIHDEIVSNNLHYYSRWWNFCQTIQLRDYFDDDNFQRFRKAVMNDTILLGGSKAYFVNDQCNHLKGVGQGNENEYAWQELEKYINSINSLEVISISKTVLDKQYQLQVKTKINSALAFLDDFEDLMKKEGNDY